jgi:hypothetical protein
MTVRLDITPTFEEVGAKLRGLSADARAEQRDKVRAAATVAQEEAQRRIHSPGGHARAGIKVKVSGSGLGIKARVVSGNRAAIFAQRSRAPGRTPPPMKAAIAMAKRYGIPKENARALALAIAEHGTRGHAVMSEALTAVKPTVTRMFQDAVLTAVRRLRS